MALRETQNSAEIDLFRQELVNLIDLRHPLVKLAQNIDWKSCEARFGGLYATGSLPLEFEDMRSTPEY